MFGRLDAPSARTVCAENANSCNGNAFPTSLGICVSVPRSASNPTSTSLVLNETPDAAPTHVDGAQRVERRPECYAAAWVLMLRKCVSCWLEVVSINRTFCFAMGREKRIAYGGLGCREKTYGRCQLNMSLPGLKIEQRHPSAIQSNAAPESAAVDSG